MSSTRVIHHIDAPRSAVYRALLDPQDVAAWMVPTGMTSRVHSFDAREGGTFRISLTYDEPTGTGKTTAHTDTYHGRFVRLVPDQEVVEVVEFETDDPEMRARWSSRSHLLTVTPALRLSPCTTIFRPDYPQKTTRPGGGCR